MHVEQFGSPAAQVIVLCLLQDEMTHEHWQLQVTVPDTAPPAAKAEPPVPRPPVLVDIPPPVAARPPVVFTTRLPPVAGLAPPVPCGAAPPRDAVVSPPTPALPALESLPPLDCGLAPPVDEP